MEKKTQQMWFKISVDYVSKYNKNLREKTHFLTVTKWSWATQEAMTGRSQIQGELWKHGSCLKKIETAIDEAQPLSTWPARMRS